MLLHNALLAIIYRKSSNYNHYNNESSFQCKHAYQGHRSTFSLHTLQKI